MEEVISKHAGKHGTIMRNSKHLTKIIDVNYDFADDNYNFTALHPYEQYKQFYEAQAAKRAMRCAFMHHRILGLAERRLRAGLTLLTKPVGALS